MLVSFIKKSQFYFICSFSGLIVLGTLLLMLPAVRTDGSALGWHDALFTATSAVCVTGLTVVNTSSFNLGGQLVILGLIQLGGLGIMTLSAAILLMMGRRMSFASTLLLANLNDHFSLRGVEGLMRTVVAYTLISEGVGVVLLYPGFLFGGHGWWESAYYAIFHSISAFCNAGFSTFDQNLCGVNAWLKVVIALLVILGGLGVYVVYDLAHGLRHRAATLRVNTKLVLVTTVVLVVAGTGLIKLQQMPADNFNLGWLDAFFTSVCARTAGFNSVDLAQLSPGSLMLIIVLMLIGASPGSTGGGMKTTTVALAAAALYNTFLGNQRVLLFRREIPGVNVLKAFVIIVIFILLAVFGSMALMLFVPNGKTMLECAFEVASALATTGYSIGISAASENGGKLLLTLFMFLGRIGPFTIFLFLMGRERSSRLTYPEERVIIG